MVAQRDPRKKEASENSIDYDVLLFWVAREKEAVNPPNTSKLDAKKKTFVEKNHLIDGKILKQERPSRVAAFVTDREINGI